MAWYQAVALSYPGQTHADGLMLLPSEKEEPSSVLPENGTALDLVLEGDMVLPVTGLVENGTAMVPVAAVAQALGYQVIYTPGEDGEGDRIAVESDQFSVQMTVGEDQIIGVTKIKGAVGMTAPADYGMAPYIAAPGTTWAPAGSLRCWAAQSLWRAMPCPSGEPGPPEKGALEYRERSAGTVFWTVPAVVDLEGDTAQISRLSFFAFSYGMWYAVSAISIREEFFIWKSCTSRTPS